MRVKVKRREVINTRKKRKRKGGEKRVGIRNKSRGRKKGSIRNKAKR
jgi:hypothetical protein